MDNMNTKFNLLLPVLLCLKYYLEFDFLYLVKF